MAPKNQENSTLALTAAQRGIWYAQLIDPGNSAFNMACYLDLPCRLDQEMFERAVRQTVAEAEGLRLRFCDVGGEPCQVVVEDTGDLELPFVDFGSAPEPRDEAEAWMRARRTRPYDPERGPMVDFALLGLSADHVLFYMGYHQLVIDGAGIKLVVQRVADVYAALRAGTSPGASPFAALREYVAEEAAYQGSVSFLADRQYFAERLADRPVPVRLSGGTPVGVARRVARQTIELTPAEVERLRAAAERVGTRWLGLVAAATGVYVARMRGTDDVLLSLVLHGRATPMARAVPTRISNVLPLRLAVRPETTWSELGERISTEIGQVRDHQRYRGEDVRRESVAADGMFFGPVINYVPPGAAWEFEGRAANLHHLETTPTEDLSVCCYRSPGGGLRIDLDAHPERYSDLELQAHRRRFLAVLNAVEAEPDRPVSEVNLLTGAERHTVLREWNDTAVAIPDATVPELFQEQVTRNPDAVAVESERERMSYAELDARAGRLAHRLAACGVGAETPVAILMERSADLVVALLAVLKAGGTYVPLDLRYPLARMRSILDGVGSSAVVVDRSTGDHEITSGRTVVRADVDELATSGRFPPAGEPDALAYIMHTSGSTGVPKGVEVTHRNIVALALDRSWRGPAHQRVLLHSPQAFDASTYELWIPLLSGGRVVLPPGEVDAPSLRRLIGAGRVTAMWLTAGLFAALAEGDPGCLDGVREVWTGGEAVSARAVRQVMDACPDLTVVNGYGPTETTTFATCFRVERDFGLDGGVPIGRPMDNMRVYVLDGRLRPVPSGAVGRLYVAGVGVARGYAGRPDLTEERFLPDPFGSPGDRMYATGDLVRWRSDGNLEYLGRVDDQVKIHGFRIEPREIEAVLEQHPLVSRAAVMVRDDTAPGGRLAACVVPTDDAGTTIGAALLDPYLRDRLPDFMVPSRYVVLDDLPLTANGKLDRKALPDPDLPVFDAPPEVQAPPSPRVEILCNLFAEILGELAVEADEDFFELGGHSLLAAKAATRIREVLGVEATVADLFGAPTPAGLADRLEGAHAVARPRLSPAARPARVPLSHAQRRFWFLYRLEGPSPTYNIPMAVRLSGELDLSALSAALADVVTRHESLRTVFGVDQGVPYQRILDPQDAFPGLHVRPVNKDALPRALSSAAGHGFELAVEPPLRATLFTLGAREHVLLLVLHHIAGDAWSLRPLGEDLRAAYSARRAGRPPGWVPLPVQYADFALWQGDTLGRATDASSVLSRQGAFWAAALAGLPEELCLPTDRPRPEHPGCAGETLRFRVDNDLHVRLLALARSTGTTLFMVVQAALAVLLTRSGAGTDIPIGTPAIGRPDPALDNLVGCFLNALVLRVDTAGDPTFTELLDRVRTADLAAYDHQDLPFEYIVERINPVRATGRQPLFQVALSVFGTPERVVELEGLRSSRVPVDNGTARFDLTFVCHERHGPEGDPAGIDGTLEYSSELFAPETAHTLATSLVRLLRAACDQPTRRIGDIALADVPVKTHGRASATAETGAGTDVPEAVRGGDLERHIAQVWCSVLGADRVGVDDNFFDLGGNSLLLVTLHAKLCAELGLDIPVQSLFSNPTVRGLARFLAGAPDSGYSGRDPVDRAVETRRSRAVHRARRR